MKLLRSYFFIHIFWRNILYAIGIVLALLLIIILSLKIYTHHGRTYAVPDYINMPLQDAIELTEGRNMRYEVFDSLYVAKKESGVILDQHPVPGFLVKKNRKIFFTINASAPGKIQMPNLVGITLREARIRLNGYGLSLGKRYYRYDISENVVLEQQFKGNVLEPGDSISKGSEVDLVLGKGLANERRMVPDVVGLTVEKAQYIAMDALFNIGAVIEDNTIAEASDTLVPFVFKQKPESNSEIRRPLGSTISLYVTLDSTKLPDYQEKKDTDYIWNELNNKNETDTSYTTNFSD